MIKPSRKYKSNYRVLLFCLAVLAVVNSVCTPKQPQSAVSSGRIIGQTQSYEPQRIILNLTENPAVSQALTWRTISATANPQAQITPAIDCFLKTTD